jgi:hypothetical protein
MLVDISLTIDEGDRDRLLWRRGLEFASPPTQGDLVRVCAEPLFWSPVQERRWSLDGTLIILLADVLSVADADPLEGVDGVTLAGLLANGWIRDATGDNT